MADKRLNIKVRTDGAKRSKQDLKGVEGGLTRLGKAAATAGSAFFAAKGLIKGFERIIQLAAEQELAERKLEVALGRVSKGLLNQASALQQVSMFGDEAIIGQQAFLASLKFSEEQIKSIIPVAIDLAAATGMSLESAVRNTAKTFSGLAGELGELVPQLRGLTAEQMMAGEAVNVLNDLFGGKAGGEKGTLTFNSRQLKMAVGDLGETFGGVFTRGVSNATEAMAGFTKQAAGVDWQTVFFNIGQHLKATGGAMAGIFTGISKANIDAIAESAEVAKEAPAIAEKVADKQKEIADEAKKAAHWTAQTASSLITSALMGDDIEDALKRAVIQLGIMVAQAKIYSAIMKASTGLFGGGLLGGIASFLFGASPTQAFPSPNGGGAKITINQNFGGMGVIDHNFAANSIIPAINKAINTGQARIG